MFKGFNQNTSAKTPSFFLSDGFGGISAEAKKDLIDLGKRTNDTVRLCLFNSPDDLLQLMLIYHPYKKNIDIQKFIEQTSIYMLVEGEFEIELFDDSLTTIKTEYISKTGNIMFRIPNGVYFKMRIISDSLLFMEVRNGPYKKEKQIIISDNK